MKFFTVIFLCLFFFCFSNKTTFGQKDGTEYSIGLVGMYGVNTLNYEIDDGVQETGWRPHLGIEGKVYFWDHFGLGLGILYSNYHARSSIASFLSSFQNQVDSESDRYDLIFSATNVSEKNKAQYLEIPITIEYRKVVNEKFSYLASFGVVTSIHLDASSKMYADQVQTTGYYPEWNVLLFNLPEHGFTTVEGWSSSVDDDFTSSFGFVAQFGADYKLNESLALYLGLYAHLGLTNVQRNESVSVMEMPYVYNSLASTADHVRLWSLGLRLGFKVWNSY